MRRGLPTSAIVFTETWEEELQHNYTAGRTNRSGLIGVSFSLSLIHEETLLLALDGTQNPVEATRVLRGVVQSHAAVQHREAWVILNLDQFVLRHRRGRTWWERDLLGYV